MISECLETDVLIIGCGIAGGTAALQLADAGIAVTIVTRTKQPVETNTYYAQGGIIYRGMEDSPELLAEDINRAGVGYCNPEAVSILAEQGPDLVKQILLERVEVPFDRTPNGDLSFVKEGSHSAARILHATDATGRAIELELIKNLVDHPNVDFLVGYTAVDLLTPAHHSLNRLAIYEPHTCVGTYLLDRVGNRVIRCLAKRTILATGGLGQIFLRTTNPVGARGDGLAMAYRAGARAINSEFIQFHPTTFHRPPAPNFLISEAVRGAGARLVNAKREPFMQKYDAEWKDLAPRDVVSRSMHQEMLENDVRNLYLDLRSFIAVNKIREEFPNIYEQCLEYGVDITRDLVPVVPAAHYACGGVWTDMWGRTTIEHLYAIGEVACTGLHGANRLASASLLEGLTWGHRAAQHIQRTLASQPAPNSDDIPCWEDTGQFPPDQALISQDMTAIKNIMWNYVGLVRTKHRLRRAMSELRHLEVEIENFYRRVWLTDQMIGLRNAVRTAIIVTTAAWENRTSIGCHYRI
jgi:L-aspartate oxidase